MPAQSGRALTAWRPLAIAARINGDASQYRVLSLWHLIPFAVSYPAKAGYPVPLDSDVNGAVPQDEAGG
jgi:hypothetical protein